MQIKPSRITLVNVKFVVREKFTRLIDNETTVFVGKHTLQLHCVKKNEMETMALMKISEPNKRNISIFIYKQ